MQLPSQRSKSTSFWLLQSALGILLLIMLGIHLLVNHWLAPDGLLSYADVIAYYNVPGIAFMEVVFLGIVSTHCLMGLHAILVDLALPSTIMKIMTWMLILLGLVILIYGVRLTWVVAAL